MDDEEIQDALEEITSRLTSLEAVRPLLVENSLSDVSDPPNARVNLGLTPIVLTDVNAYALKAEMTVPLQNALNEIDAIATDVLTKVSILTTELYETRRDLIARVTDLENKFAGYDATRPNPLPVAQIPTPNLSSSQAIANWARAVSPVLDTMRAALLHVGLISEA